MSNYSIETMKRYAFEHEVLNKLNIAKQTQDPKEKEKTQIVIEYLEARIKSIKEVHK
jgi:hypothetical protein